MSSFLDHLFRSAEIRENADEISIDEIKRELTPKQIQEYKEAFQLYDKNQDGTISINELGTLLRCLGQNPAQDDVEQMMDFADRDGSGSLDFVEFLYLMIKQERDTFSHQEIREAFKVFDKDGNGYVSATELRHVMGKLGVNFSDDELFEMITEADVDGDGQVNFSEFYNMMTSK